MWGVIQERVYQKLVRNVDELKQHLIEAWLGISGEIVLMRVSKPKANICCGVFAHNCQFVMTFNACISVVMNRVTHVCFTR